MRKELKDQKVTTDFLEHKVDMARDMIDNFKKEDVYINSMNNYLKLYSEMANQRHQIDLKFKPEIDQIKKKMMDLITTIEKRQKNIIKEIVDLKEGVVVKELAECKIKIQEVEYDVLTIKAKLPEIDKLEQTIWSNDYQEKVNQNLLKKMMKKQSD